MDTNEQFYFVAIGTGDLLPTDERTLIGVDFQGGLSSATISCLGNCLWLVDKVGQRDLTGIVKAFHQPGFGYRLAMCNQMLPTFPCLFTTDSKAHPFYSGRVLASANDESFEFEELPESGIPLTGDGWLGALRRRGSELWMDAYITREAAAGQKLMAVCPDWNVGFDEPEALIFTVELVDADSVAATEGCE